MSFHFFVSEDDAEKLYKLIVAKLARNEALKIISKETKRGKIHFAIYFIQLNPDTEECLSQEFRYKSVDKGVTKRQFDKLIENMLSQMPETADIKLHDLSRYSSLKEQFSTGIVEGIFEIAYRGSV